MACVIACIPCCMTGVIACMNCCIGYLAVSWLACLVPLRAWLVSLGSRGKQRLQALTCAMQLNVVRLYVGAFITSLDTKGVSISLMPVDKQRMAWLDAPTQVKHSHHPSPLV